MLSRLILIVGAGVLGSGALAAAAENPPPPLDLKKEIASKCGAPPLGIVTLDGKTATKTEMEEAKFQVTSFITQSDVYQECVLKASAAVAKRLTERDKVMIVNIITAVQSEKEAVGKAYNDAADAFNARDTKPTE